MDRLFSDPCHLCSSVAKPLLFSTPGGVPALWLEARILDAPTPVADTARPMSRAIILQHAAHASAGRIVPIFRDFGIPVEIRKLWQGDEVPTDLDELRLLVVLGGMKFSDLGNEKYPFLATEVATLQRMVAIDRMTLGIGFGAQLLAHAAGAKVHPNVKPAPPVPHGQSAPPAEAGSPAPPPTFCPNMAGRRSRFRFRGGPSRWSMG